MNYESSSLVTKSQGGGRVHPDLEALLVLQEKDVAVTSCDARLKALDPELRTLDEQIAAAERVVEQARAGIQAALDRRARAGRERQNQCPPTGAARRKHRRGG